MWSEGSPTHTHRALPSPFSAPPAPSLQTFATLGPVDAFCNGPALLEDGRVMMAGGQYYGYMPLGFYSVMVSAHACIHACACMHACIRVHACARALVHGHSAWT